MIRYGMYVLLSDITAGASWRHNFRGTRKPEIWMKRSVERLTISFAAVVLQLSAQIHATKSFETFDFQGISSHVALYEWVYVVFDKAPDGYIIALAHGTSMRANAHLHLGSQF